MTGFWQWHRCLAVVVAAFEGQLLEAVPRNWGMLASQGLAPNCHYLVEVMAVQVALGHFLSTAMKPNRLPPTMSCPFPSYLQNDPPFHHHVALTSELLADNSAHFHSNYQISSNYLIHLQQWLLLLLDTRTISSSHPWGHPMPQLPFCHLNHRVLVLKTWTDDPSHVPSMAWQALLWHSEGHSRSVKLELEELHSQLAQNSLNTLVVLLKMRLFEKESSAVSDSMVLEVMLLYNFVVLL